MPEPEQPEQISGPTPVSSSRRRKLLERAAIAVTVTGGVVLCASVMAPVRLQGATASGKLKWQKAGEPVCDIVATNAAPAKLANQQKPND